MLPVNSFKIVNLPPIHRRLFRREGEGRALLSIAHVSRYERREGKGSVAAAARAARLPADAVEVPDAFARHGHAFRDQQRPFQRLAAAVAAEPAAGGDHAVTG